MDFQGKQPYGRPKTMLRQFAEMLVILIAAAAVLNFLNIRKTGSSSVFAFQEDCFTFSPCDGVSCTVEYREIVSLSLVDTPESFDACSAGGTAKNLVFGCWMESGEETLVYVQTTLPKTILLETTRQRLMFNFTDRNSTEALYNSLYEIWQSESQQTGE